MAAVSCGAVYAQSPLTKIATETDSLTAKAGDPIKKFYVLPIISASPETSLRLGAVGIFLFRQKNVAPVTQLSSIRVPISYTFNQQFQARINANYYSNYNKHIAVLTAEYFNYPLLFYGIGNNTQASDEEIYTTRTITFDFDYLKSIVTGFYIGLGYSYFRSNIVETIQGGFLSEPGLIPGNTGAMTSGLSLSFRYDNRDNNLSATRGIYVNAKLSNFEPSFGSEFDYTRFDLDLRKYFTPFGKHVLALQLVLADTWGDPPFEKMALLGGKTIMRGHYEGRFRDNTLYALQAEYRLPLVRKNWIDDREKVPFRERWGLVAFLGAGDVASSFGDIDIKKIKPSYGVGLRYLVLPKERINVRIDFGFGSQFPGLYFNIREAF